MSDARPFVIVAAARTGSSHLVTLLDSHPEVAAASELLNDVLIRTGGEICWFSSSDRAAAVRFDAELIALRARDPVAFLLTCNGMARDEGYPVFGFKLLYDHGRNCGPAMDFLRELPELKVVHLRRRDRLRRYLSHERARRTGEWTAAGAVGERPDRLELDWDDCVADFERIEADEQRYANFFAARDVLEIGYEDLVADPVTTDRLLAHLGVAVRPLHSGMQRQETRPLRDAIANFDTLADRARGTRWAALFGGVI